MATVEELARRDVNELARKVLRTIVDRKSQAAPWVKDDFRGGVELAARNLVGAALRSEQGQKMPVQELVEACANRLQLELLTVMLKEAKAKKANKSKHKTGG